MNVIKQVYLDHEDLARVLDKHAGIRKIVEDLYPDSAHFIYELLQNAEDAVASEVIFVLSDHSLIFEHNGRPFNEADIRAITDIGDGTKAKDEDQIGRFGIGFKAVFAYTETPRVWSPTYAFEISRMVLPSAIPMVPGLDNRTRFEFPFNSEKKSPTQAFVEIRDGLTSVSDDTLLFLSHIVEIKWTIDDDNESHILRICHSDCHVEILRELNGEPTQSSHFLRFTKPVDGLERQHVAIAFELQPSAENPQMDALTPIGTRFQIAPAANGCVAVYFTAAKETSNLRFHLHAPFVPDLSRSSVKDTPANQPLFEQIARLAAQSLSTVRDLGLLDRDFLAVLPNSDDNIPDRYGIIRDAIVNAMNERPLTPKHAGGHAPASHLLQAEAGLKTLLNGSDIRFLVDSDDGRCAWAVAATQRNSRIDRFLNDLDIQEWGVAQFVEVLGERCSNCCRSTYSYYVKTPQDPDPIFMDWIADKSLEWHRKLYDLFQQRLENRSNKFEDILIVRCSDGKYRIGSECYFPTLDSQEDSIHPRVEERTYATAGTPTEQKRAKEFLEGIGVREIGEWEQVEAILIQRYVSPEGPTDWKLHESDLRRFIRLVEKDKHKVDFFRKYFFLQGSDGSWLCPANLYLDTPHSITGLRAYYDRPAIQSQRAALSDDYENFDLHDRLVEFSRTCGVIDRLEVKKVYCYDNPCYSHLKKKAPGVHHTGTGVNYDFVVPDLKYLLESPNLDLSRIVWKALSDPPRDENILKAAYSRNQSNEPHYAPSQLVHHLRDAAWIPQKDGACMKFVRPAEALREHLPHGFPFDSGWPWLSAIGFGTEAEEQVEERRQIKAAAARLGFSDETALADARLFVKLPADLRQQLLAKHNNRVDLPTHTPGHSDRRTEQVREEAKHAPDRTKEVRERSVSPNLDKVKKERTDPYLRAQYTNHDDITICQICQDSLPFKLHDGSYYFESIEFLNQMKKHYYQNYLVLCPNHAAMFKHANESKHEIREQFLVMDGSQLKLTLAGQAVAIYFTETHIVDLRAIIASEDES